MTTLTPPSAEQCAFVDEAARQFKTGEAKANYWVWHCNSRDVSLTYSYPRITDEATALEYHPSPAHPHYATYCHWKQLLDAGEVGCGWWHIMQTDSLKTKTATYSPKWHIDFEYKICKSEKHPDNVKPALKLIDWSKVPVGAMTNEGFIVKPYSTSAVVFSEMLGTKEVCHAYLRLVEQTKFTHIPVGTPPPVLEELVFEYEVISTIVCRYTYTDLKNKVYRDCIAYRVIGLAPGYTDNPELAK